MDRSHRATKYKLSRLMGSESLPFSLFLLTSHFRITNPTNPISQSLGCSFSVTVSPSSSSSSSSSSFSSSPCLTIAIRERKLHGMIFVLQGKDRDSFVSVPFSYLVGSVMSLTSLQVCMDSADWLQDTIHDESGMDSSSPSGDMLTCSRPLIERRLRPPHDQALKCPRCDSTHTKFCYYNNYSLSQPRYFCKTCRRYWTKGGTLRNIPVGGGCRKNKKVSKKSSDPSVNQNPGSASSSHHPNPTDLRLSFPEMQISHLSSILNNQGTFTNPSFMESKYNLGMLEPRPIDFMEGKLETIAGSSRNYDFMGNGEMGMVGFGDPIMSNHGLPPNFQGLCSPLGDANGGNMMETCQRLMLPYDQGNEVDVKPNPKLLSLEWQDQGSSYGGKESFGYLNNYGTWSGMINGYGSSTTNQMV